METTHGSVAEGLEKSQNLVNVINEQPINDKFWSFAYQVTTKHVTGSSVGIWFRRQLTLQTSVSVWRGRKSQTGCVVTIAAKKKVLGMKLANSEI